MTSCAPTSTKDAALTSRRVRVLAGANDVRHRRESDRGRSPSGVAVPRALQDVIGRDRRVTSPKRPSQSRATRGASATTLAVDDTRPASSISTMNPVHTALPVSRRFRTSSACFHSLLAGAFLNRLYYRLNSVYLPLSDGPTVEVDADSPGERLRHTGTMERVFRSTAGAPPMRS